MKRPPLTEHQVSLLTKQEYDHLQAAYSTLVQSFEMLENSSLKLITKEEQEFQLRVTGDGWKVTEGGSAAERERTWEMVEDLLRSISPRFKKGWDMMLLEKLEALAASEHHTAEEA